AVGLIVKCVGCSDLFDVWKAEFETAWAIAGANQSTVRWICEVCSHPKKKGFRDMADKDFFNLREVTREFREEVKADDMTKGQRWFVVSTLAVAQQLVVISGRLGELVELLKDAKK